MDEDTVDDSSKKLLKLQFFLGLAVTSLFYLLYGPWSGLSALMGSAASIVTALHLRYDVSRASKSEDAAHSMKILYFGAVQRFLLVLALFAIAISVIGLNPLAVCLSFAIVHFGFFFMAKMGKSEHKGNLA